MMTLLQLAMQRKRLLRQSLSLPSTLFQCDLLNMPAVAQLERDEQYQLLYDLLKMFLTKRIDSYSEFQTVNSALLKDYGLVHEDCITKMRLMSLLDLSSHCSREVPYSAITSPLQINDDEVEQWIVKALAFKILDCRVGQLTETVIVRYSSAEMAVAHDMGPATVEKPRFDALMPSEMGGGKPQFRKVPVPQHCSAPLKHCWMEIYTAVYEHVKVDIRMNIKSRRVELKTRTDTPDVSNVQKCADFVHVFMLGFDIAGVVALLRLDDIYVDFFEIP